MTDFHCLHDKAVIEKFLRRETDLHLYEIRDLAEFFWPHTLWFASSRNNQLSVLCLLYLGQSQPTLLALGEPDPLKKLIKSISDLLPQWFYAHLSPGVELAFLGTFQLESHGDHLKMSLKRPALIKNWKDSGSVRLGPEDLAEVLKLYEESYTGNWFDPRMLETREYFGVRKGSRLVSIAGIHVFSPEHRVAALGNITTAKSHRQKGLATLVTRELCRSLLDKVDHIGLNVAANNHAALSCYRKLGFDIVAPYGEFSVQRIP